MSVEEFDQLGEVGERSSEPIYLVDHHDAYPAGRDVCQQALQCRPFDVPAGEARYLDISCDTSATPPQVNPGAVLRVADIPEPCAIESASATPRTGAGAGCGGVADKWVESPVKIVEVDV